MNIEVYKEQPKTMMSTKEIAELTGKLHKNIIRDCEDMIIDIITSKHGSNLSHEDYQALIDYRGYVSEVLLNRELTETLVMGYSPALRYAVVKRLKFLESKLEAVGNLNIISHYEEEIKQLRQTIDRKNAEMSVNSTLYNDLLQKLWALQDKMSIDTQLSDENHWLKRQMAELQQEVYRMESVVTTTQQQNRNVMLAVNNVMQIENKAV